MGRRHTLSSVVVLLVFALVATACPSGSDDDATSTSLAPETSLASGDPESATTSLPEAEPDPQDDEPAELPPIVVPDPDPTPIPTDPAIRIGTLDNGLTYYLRSNQAPGQKLELRLVVKAGSLQQEVPDSGLAHFTEHMLFNGTESYPGNELDRVFQGFGIEFGPDVNAYTSWEETVYEISLALGDEQATDDAFNVLAEWGSKALIDEQEVIDERGVVREERRVRSETANGRLGEVFNEAYTVGTPYEGYLPIGSSENILATTSEDARRYYDRWYRPDNMAVVIVGDLPLDEMEDRVRDSFSDLDDRGDGQERTDAEQVPIDDVFIERVVDPELTRPFVSLDYWIPTWDTTTVGGDRLSLLDFVVGEMIRIRLETAVARGELRGIDPSVGPFSQARQLSFMGYNLGGSDLAATTEDLFEELKRLELEGFDEAELNQTVLSFQGFVDSQRAGASTRQDAALAGQYVNHFLGSGSIDTADATADRLTGVLESFTLEEANNHFRYLQSVSAPLLIVVGSDEASVPSIEELEAAVAAGTSAELTERADIEEIDQLMDRPEPVEELERIVHDEINGVELVFENGARALFVPSGIDAGEFNLRARSEGGWSQLDEGEGPLASLATAAVARSGLGDIDPVQLDTFLAGSFVAVSPTIGEIDEGFSGSGSVEDAEIAFQLMHLYVTEPRVDPSGLASAVEDGEVRIRRAETDPQTQSFAAINDARYGGSPFQLFAPTSEQLENFGAEDALRIYESRLDDVDDLVVAVAGDANQADMEDLFRRYVGTLPAGERDTWVDLRPDPPPGVIELEVEAGTDSSGAGIDMLFTSLGPVDDRTRLSVQLIETMISSRLIDTVREDLGATYGARVRTTVTERPEEGIDVFISVSGDPERLDLIEETVLAEVRDLADNGPSEDEFERALAVLRADYDFVSNNDLLIMLLVLGRTQSGDPFTRTEARSLLDDLSRQEVSAVAARMFPDGQRIQVTRQ